MTRLGYQRYGAHGGDWGAAISRELGRIRPPQVIGVHLNLIPGASADTEPDEQELSRLTPAERERTIASWPRNLRWSAEQDGYGTLQASCPQTLAYALTDSPIGQLAWIAEKFKEWTDSRDRPEDAVDRDQLLTNVMLYWLTGTAGSAARIYYERAHASYQTQAPEVSTTPTALADFPAENFITLRHITDRTNNIVRWTSFERGGHFAAMEQPDLLVTDAQVAVAVDAGGPRARHRCGHLRAARVVAGAPGQVRERRAGAERRLRAWLADHEPARRRPELAPVGHGVGAAERPVRTRLRPAYRGRAALGPGQRPRCPGRR
jgi:hypothetical protein